MSVSQLLFKVYIKGKPMDFLLGATFTMFTFGVSICTSKVVLYYWVVQRYKWSQNCKFLKHRVKCYWFQNQNDTVVLVHGFFFFWWISPSLNSTPTAVILISSYESVSILLVSSVCSEDSTYGICLFVGVRGEVEEGI